MDYKQSIMASGLTVVSCSMPGFEGSCVASFAKTGSRNETMAFGVA